MDLKETVIQFGEGNFLRGFADYFLHILNESGAYDGKAVIVQPRIGGKVAGLNAQKCKYNLYLRGIKDFQIISNHHLIESVSRCVDPYKDFEKFIELALNPDFRFIISNTTEAGIEFDSTCKFTDTPCVSFPGKLTQLLYKRFESGLSGFILLPCELIDNNGDALKECVQKYADLWNLGNDFKKWLENENTFANTLVDRIVTGYPKDETASLHPDDIYLDTAELFHLWVIEGNFEDELPLQKAGFNVIWTDDVKPYKKTKVRILNGAHTSIVLGAILGGLETVGECMTDDTVSAFLNKCMTEEILPTIGESESNVKFAADVFDRFRNPFIKHQLRAIALNSISKFSVRVLPTLLEYKEKFDTYPEGLTMSLAFLIYFYKNDVTDDSDKEAMEFIKKESINDILSNVDIWQTDLSPLTDTVNDYYEKIAQCGAKEAMKWIL